MKKTSLLSLLWLAGLLTFVALPTFAQEEPEEDVVAATEDVVVEDVVEEEATVAADYSDEEDAVALEADSSDDFFDAIAQDSEVVEQLNEGADQMLEQIWDEEFTISFNKLFKSKEERAQAIAALGLLFAGAGMIYAICAIIWLIIWVIALWIIFNKAWEKGWKAIIPIYNIYIWFKIVGMKNWFWYMLLIAFVWGLAAGFLPKYEEFISPITSIICGIIGIVSTFKLPRKFGWGVFTSILFVLFTLICMLVLAFGSSKYEGEKLD